MANYYKLGFYTYFIILNLAFHRQDLIYTVLTVLCPFMPRKDKAEIAAFISAATQP